MKAAVVRGNYDIGVEEIETPGIGGAADILTKVRLCGICGGDLHYYKLGAHPEIGYAVDKGRVLGHQWMGEVVDIGPEVRGLPGRGSHHRPRGLWGHGGVLPADSLIGPIKSR